MSIIETFLASYKGVEFLALSTTTSGGRKDVLFEFPNSNKQKVEDLGLKPRSYNVTAIIPHDGYYTKRDRLLAVLEEGGGGVLEHPMYGVLEDIVARTYTINEQISELGRAQVSIVFAVSDSKGPPQKAVNSVSEVARGNAKLTNELNTGIANNFSVDTKAIGNFQDAQTLLGDVATAIDDAVNTAAQVSSKINQFSSQINQFTSSINRLVTVPQDLADSVSNLFSTVNGLFGTVESTLSVYRELFDFGSTDTLGAETTAGLIQRTSNRSQINQFMQMSSLGYAYLNAVQIDFQTTDDIDIVNDALDSQYSTVMSNALYDDEARQLITDVRTLSNQLFDEKRTNARKIIEIDTPLLPMSEVAYRYYGDTDLTDTLLKLNNVTNSAFVQGTIKILTQ